MNYLVAGPEFQNGPNERTLVSPDVSFDDLVDILAAANIPIEKYGKDEAKSLDHLLKEVHSGEARLTIGELGNLLREISLVRLDVICELSNGDVKILKEVKQVFNDGRQRTRLLDTSLGEKLGVGEHHADAVSRALLEELSIQSTTGIYSLGSKNERTQSQSYPGIETSMQSHYYVATIPESEYSPSGYIETQTDKSTYFSWEPLARL